MYKLSYKNKNILFINWHTGDNVPVMLNTTQERYDALVKHLNKLYNGVPDLATVKNELINF